MKLFRSLVISILLYGYKGWTHTADRECRAQAFECKCYKRQLHISYKYHKTNDYVRQQVITYAGSHQLLLMSVKHHNLAWYWHVSRHNTLSKIILQGIVEEKLHKGRQKNSTVDSILDWTVTVYYMLH